MATKAQQFRHEMERAGPKKAPQAKKEHHLDRLHTDSRNVTKWGDKKVGVALEDSMSGRPSRKSTRRSAHGGRNDAELMRVARNASHAPKVRASRAKAARR
ncbi:MAG: hypothetical protein IT380_13200 [Myxococcales bacterium]|nr:hypothetical protein [Myxococcales bacterium]